MKLLYQFQSICLLLFLGAAALTSTSLGLYAQCDLNQEIVNICQTDPEWKYSPAIYPVCDGSQNPDGTDSSGLRWGEVGRDYGQDFTVILPDSIYYEALDVILDFNYAVLTNPNDIGLPPGMNLIPDPSITDWTLEGSSAYCLEMAGAPEEDGVFPLSLVLEFCAAVSGVPICIDTTINCYGIEIVPVGVEDRQHSIGASLSPNPVQQQATFSVDVPKALQAEFKLYDVLGHCLRTEDWQLNAGSNEIAFDRAGLSTGIYLYSIDDFASGQFIITE